MWICDVYVCVCVCVFGFSSHSDFFLNCVYHFSDKTCWSILIKDYNYSTFMKCNFPAFLFLKRETIRITRSYNL